MIAGQRDRVFLVSKVWPYLVMGDGVARACDAAYSVLGDAGASLLRDPALPHIGAAQGSSPTAVALAATIRHGNVIAIPESGAAEHLLENAVALSLTLSPDELHALDAAHPPPNR